jgi:hypothetical protein
MIRRRPVRPLTGANSRDNSDRHSNADLPNKHRETADKPKRRRANNSVDQPGNNNREPSYIHTLAPHTPEPHSCKPERAAGERNNNPLRIQLQKTPADRQTGNSRPQGKGQEFCFS